jgi:arylformamidase
MTIWDISPPIDEQSAVFGGDTPYTQRLHFPLGPGCPVNVHAITLSPHTGAHGDAPLHYAATEPRTGKSARTSGELPLQPYLGPCRVIHALGFDAPQGCGERVQLAQIKHALAQTKPLPARVLIRTRMHATQAWDDFSALSPALIEHLASCGVQLVGLDTPSVDTATSQDLASHQALLHHDMRVLENLVLDDVPEGDYELIALPLKLMKSDASPVRAVLRSLGS